jgi:hypothetical protein
MCGNQIDLVVRSDYPLFFPLGDFLDANLNNIDVQAIINKDDRDKH